jgi:peptidoglycan/xylan/chitin deacetylase (PgdA/CDA1 family)
VVADKRLPRRTATGVLVAGVLSSVLVGARPVGGAEPEAVARSITVTAPKPGEWVRGTVPLKAHASEATAAVLFEVSLDGGQTWTPVGIDDDPADGWEARWNTLEYNGRARLRASSAGVPPERDAVSVHVDNTAPRAELHAKPRLFSPNRDGRRDTTRLKLRTNEPVRARLRVRRNDRVWKRWNLPLRKGRKRVVTWSGRTFRSELPDGRYRVIAQVRDRAGSRTTGSTSVVVDTTPPRLTALRISPKRSEDRGRIRVTYRAKDRTDRLIARARIVGGGGTLSRERDRTRTGRHSIRLRARYGNGDKLYPGQYKVVVDVRDRAGNRSSRHRVWRVHRSMRARVFTRLEGTGWKVALTFDDCHIPGAWSRILETLERWDERATFFCPGQMLDRFPALARHTVRAGHAIGSHGWDHAVLAFRSYDDVYWRLLRDRRTWIKYGATSAPYFRPPYGAWDATTRAASGATSHPRIVLWDVDSGDTAGASGSTLVCNVVCDARKGSIILLHTKDVTADALPAILRGLRERNLEPVTLPDLFRAAGFR